MCLLCCRSSTIHDYDGKSAEGGGIQCLQMDGQMGRGREADDAMDSGGKVEGFNVFRWIDR